MQHRNDVDPAEGRLTVHQAAAKLIADGLVTFGHLPDMGFDEAVMNEVWDGFAELVGDPHGDFFETAVFNRLEGLPLRGEFGRREADIDRWSTEQDFLFECDALQVFAVATNGEAVRVEYPNGPGYAAAAIDEGFNRWWIDHPAMPVTTESAMAEYRATVGGTPLWT